MTPAVFSAPSLRRQRSQPGRDSVLAFCPAALPLTVNHYRMLRSSPVPVFYPSMGRRDYILHERRDAIRSTAVQYNARSIALAGSVARREDTSSSDVDFLVDFLPGTTLFDIAGLQIALEDMLGCHVDVVSVSGIRDRCQGMLAEAIPL